MLPWDFGIINAIKKELSDYAVYPSNPPIESQIFPYIVVSMKNSRINANSTVLVEMLLSIVDRDNVSNTSYTILRALMKLMRRELTLRGEENDIGKAYFRINHVDTKQNALILNLTGILNVVTQHDA